MQQMSISFAKAGGGGSIEHNNRDLDAERLNNQFHQHINQAKTWQNVQLKKQDIKSAYHELFDDALDEYNRKQKRADRKIDNYYNHVKGSKTLETHYEFIVQVGRKDQFTRNDFIKNYENWDTANDILKEYFNEFEERNPHFHVYNAVIHNDEATPHLHLNVIPVAEGYKRGLSKQPGFNKALECQGLEIDKTDSRAIFKAFRDQEVKAVEGIMQKHDLERQIVGTNDIKSHHQYRAVAQAHEKELAQKEKELTKKDEELERYDSRIAGRKKQLERLNKQEVRVRKRMSDTEKEIENLKNQQFDADYALKKENERLRKEKEAVEEENKRLEQESRLQKRFKDMVQSQLDKAVEIVSSYFNYKGQTIDLMKWINMDFRGEDYLEELRYQYEADQEDDYQIPNYPQDDLEL